jgi:hypothetical protein
MQTNNNTNKQNIIIPFVTMDKLFNKGQAGVDAVLLYGFLQKTAIIQNAKYGTNNRPLATRGFCKEKLHWGTKRYDAANHLLISEGLKRARTVAYRKGRSGFMGRIAELPYINLNPVSKALRIESPRTGPHTDGTFIHTDISTSNDLDSLRSSSVAKPSVLIRSDHTNGTEHKDFLLKKDLRTKYNRPLEKVGVNIDEFDNLFDETCHQVAKRLPKSNVDHNVLRLLAKNFYSTIYQENKHTGGTVVDKRSYFKDPHVAFAQLMKLAKNEYTWEGGD